MVRAAGVLVAGSFLAMVLGMAGSDLASETKTISGVTTDGAITGNWVWIQVVANWWPAVILATIAAILIGSAIARRGQTRV